MVDESNKVRRAYSSSSSGFTTSSGSAAHRAIRTTCKGKANGIKIIVFIDWEQRAREQRPTRQYPPLSHPLNNNDHNTTIALIIRRQAASQVSQPTSRVPPVDLFSMLLRARTVSPSRSNGTHNYVQLNVYNYPLNYVLCAVVVVPGPNSSSKRPPIRNPTLI